MTLKYFTAEMPLRQGEHRRLEQQAKALAGGVGWHDSQPWKHPPARERIKYPQSKNRQTRIPQHHSWTEVVDSRPYVYDYGDAILSRFDKRQRSTEPWQRRPCVATWRHDTSRKQPWTSIPLPEGHHLPEGVQFKGQSVINTMTFDDTPWLDTAPLEVQAKAGYTNFSNDHKALVTAFEKGRFKTDGQGRWYRQRWGPGDFWRREDQKHRKAGTPKPCTAEASRPPKVLGDSWEFVGIRVCKSCSGAIPDVENVNAKVRYCSERCRNRSEYVARSGIAGTAEPWPELPTFVVNGKRIGLDTDDLGFSRLLAGVA